MVWWLRIREISANVHLAMNVPLLLADKRIEECIKEIKRNLRQIQPPIPFPGHYITEAIQTEFIRIH